jgi:hypothetical protein
MQTPSLIKLDGSHDSVGLRCLITIKARPDGKGRHGSELNHVARLNYLPKNGWKRRIEGRWMMVNTDVS